MSNVKKFNYTINNLFEDLITLYPDNKLFIINQEKFNMLIKYNVKKVMNEFYNYLYKYKNEILNKNDIFFLEKICQIDNKSNLNKLMNLKDIWVNLNNENKETVWLYFQVLIALVEKEYSS